MPSFKEIIDLLLLSHDQGLISDEEFAILHDEYRPANLTLPYDPEENFDIGAIADDECKAEFRVEKRDLFTLAEVLQIPEEFKCPQRSKIDGMEGLCMLLKRCAYPCRYSDMMHRFQCPVPVLSMATNEVLNYIYNMHGHLITEWNQDLMSPQKLVEYSQAITAKGSPLTNCFGFVDGTVRPIARPGRNQRLVYNGHKRVHSLKFQSLALPNGMIGNLFGPMGKYFYVVYHPGQSYPRSTNKISQV